MKKTLLIIALVLSFVTLQAKPVDVTTARRVAASVLGTSNLVDRTSELALPELYLFAPAESQGFVVVAADDCARPVVGYSLTSPFRADVAPVRSWLTSCAGQIADMRQRGIEGSTAVAESWGQMLGVAPIEPKTTVIRPLMTTIWDQSDIYQQRTPYDAESGTHCLAGCGAIAMAQVMKYWNHPATGHGANSYTTASYEYGPLTADFDTAYAWADMPDSLTWASSQAQIDAVNQLVYHVGVALEMDYTPEWSNSYVYYEDYYGASTETAMPKYFKYRSSIRSVTMDEYSAAEWDSLLMVELRALRPVIYRGADPNVGGHIFVLDGCDGNGCYHFNWGWGGYCDGFYAIGSLNTSEYDAWNLGNCAIVGIEPLTNFESEVTIAGVANNSEWGNVVVNGAGTYQPSYDYIVSLQADAADGYRFDRWSDGSLHNPRYYPALESRSDTAIFVPAGTDTVGYCLPRYYFNYGYSRSRTTYGAVGFPTSTLSDGIRLAAAQFYVTQPGNYIVNVHCGDSNQPGPVVFSQGLRVDETGRWVTLQFDSLVSFPRDSALWLSMKTNAVYAIPVSRYGGNERSFFFGSDGHTWYDCHIELGYLSAMLRAVFVDPTASISGVEAADMTVSVRGRTVSVHAANGGDLAVYDLAGHLLGASRGTTLRFTAPVAGVYIVRSGASAKKVILQ